MPYFHFGQCRFICEFGNKQCKRINQPKGPFCNAYVYVSKFMFFPEFKGKQDKLFPERYFQKRLEKGDEKLNKRTVYVMSFPKLSRHLNHIHHPEDERHSATIDHRITMKMQDFSLRGMTSEEIRHGVDRYVKDEIFHNKELPDPSDKRYYPQYYDVGGTRRRVFSLCTISLPNIEKLESRFKELREKQGAEVYFKIDEPPMEERFRNRVQDIWAWENRKNKPKPDEGVDVEELTQRIIEQDILEIRKFNDAKPWRQRAPRPLWNTPIQKVFFFHQTRHQQLLLNRYGSMVHFYEIKPPENLITYRALMVSLFLICVRTNVDYQVVGTILCNKYNDHVKVLTEALTEFKEINSSWKPKHLVIDPTEAMVSVVRELFPGVEYVFNGESCVRQWKDSLKPHLLNGIINEDTKKLQADLRVIQQSSSMDEFTDRIEDLSESEMWNNESLLEFRRFWFAHTEKWVKCCFPQNLNCLLEDDWLRKITRNYQDLVLMSSYRNVAPLEGFEGGMERLLCYLTGDSEKEIYKSYVQKNQSLFTAGHCVLKNSKSLVHNYKLPIFLMSHCHPILSAPQQVETHIQKVSTQEYTVFELKDKILDRFHVSLGDQSIFPSCTCTEWINNPLLCRHMFQVFKMYTLDFESISPLYKSSPFFTIDYLCIDQQVRSISTETTQSSKGTQSEERQIVKYLPQPIFKTMKNVNDHSMSIMEGLNYYIDKLANDFMHETFRKAFKDGLQSLEKKYLKKAKRGSTKTVCLLPAVPVNGTPASSKKQAQQTLVVSLNQAASTQHETTKKTDQAPLIQHVPASIDHVIVKSTNQNSSVQHVTAKSTNQALPIQHVTVSSDHVTVKSTNHAPSIQHMSAKSTNHAPLIKHVTAQLNNQTSSMEQVDEQVAVQSTNQSHSIQHVTSKSTNQALPIQNLTATTVNQDPSIRTVIIISTNQDTSKQATKKPQYSSIRSSTLTRTADKIASFSKVKRTTEKPSSTSVDSPEFMSIDLPELPTYVLHPSSDQMVPTAKPAKQMAVSVKYSNQLNPPKNSSNQIALSMDTSIQSTSSSKANNSITPILPTKSVSSVRPSNKMKSVASNGPHRPIDISAISAIPGVPIKAPIYLIPVTSASVPQNNTATSFNKKLQNIVECFNEKIKNKTILPSNGSTNIDNATLKNNTDNGELQKLSKTPSVSLENNVVKEHTKPTNPGPTYPTPGVKLQQSKDTIYRLLRKQYGDAIDLRELNECHYDSKTIDKITKNLLERDKIANPKTPETASQHQTTPVLPSNYTIDVSGRKPNKVPIPYRTTTSKITSPPAFPSPLSRLRRLAPKPSRYIQMEAANMKKTSRNTPRTRSNLNSQISVFRKKTSLDKRKNGDETNHPLIPHNEIKTENFFDIERRDNPSPRKQHDLSLHSIQKEALEKISSLKRSLDESLQNEIVSLGNGNAKPNKIMKSNTETS
eukprot:TCONS_00062537-protein